MIYFEKKIKMKAYNTNEKNGRAQQTVNSVNKLYRRCLKVTENTFTNFFILFTEKIEENKNDTFIKKNWETRLIFQ